MSEIFLSPEDALAVLMSIPDVEERRDYVAEDLDADRKLQRVDRLSLALVLEVPFGREKEWRRMGRKKMQEEITNESAVAYLKMDDKAWVITDHFQGRMRKQRFEQLEKAIGAFYDSESDSIEFTFTKSELDEISVVLAADLGSELGGELFWSRDEVLAPCGYELRFVFSMLSRKQLLGCIAGPYDELDDLIPGDYGLIDLDEDF